MEKPVILYKPIYAEISPLGNFIAAELFMAGLSVVSFLIARYVAVGESDQMISFTGYSLAALLAFLIPYTIFLRISAHRSTIRVSDNGITIATPTLQQHLSWGQLTLLFMTTVIYSRHDHKEGFFYLFFKVQSGDLPESVVDYKNGVPYHFVGTAQDFKSFLGQSEPFDFAICLGNISDLESARLIALLPNGNDRMSMKVRPLVQVQTPEEYNKIVTEAYLPEIASIYVLPVSESPSP
jgi:hypothetical protein